jgi:RNA ligase
MFQIKIEDVNKEVAEERVRPSSHNDLPLTIYCYSEQTQFEKKWNDVNRYCRGLVFDNLGRCVNHPFPKFFNYEELNEEEKIKFSPDKLSTVCSKEDGSLIIVFWYIENWVISTKGSFHSEQSVIASKMLKAHPTFFSSADKSSTYLFELTGPSNINVCRGYKKDSLILLAIRNNKGDEPWDRVSSFAKDNNFQVPNVFQAWSQEFYLSLKENKDPNIEGVVLFNKEGERCKVKTDLYVSLHRLVTNLTERSLFEMWLSGSEVYIKGIPDEFFEEIRQGISNIQSSWLEHRKIITEQWEEAKGLLATLSRKEVAINHSHLLPVLTDALANRSPDRVAFKSFCSSKGFPWDSKKNPWEAISLRLALE